MGSEPFASTWITRIQVRTPQVILQANPNYWNTDRGPRLSRVIFRNDLAPEQALQLCLNTEGQVDIVTGVAPTEADRVLASSFANLVAVNETRLLAGIFNRFSRDVNLNNIRLRRALNLAVNRKELVEKAFRDYATIVPSMTPPWNSDYLEELKPYPYMPDQARKLFWEAGWPIGRSLRLTSLDKYKEAALALSKNLETSLEVRVELMIIPPEEEYIWKQVLAEKKLTPSWDILLIDTLALFSESAPAFFHREWLGYDGAFRAGPLLPVFEKLYSQFARETDPTKRIAISQQIDKYVFEEALALFLVSPKALYAVNKQVNFQPYRTSLEFAETEVTINHWSRHGLLGPSKGTYKA